MTMTPAESEQGRLASKRQRQAMVQRLLTDVFARCTTNRDEGGSA